MRLASFPLCLLLRTRTELKRERKREKERKRGREAAQLSIFFLGFYVYFGAFAFYFAVGCAFVLFICLVFHLPALPRPRFVSSFVSTSPSSLSLFTLFCFSCRCFFLLCVFPLSFPTFISFPAPRHGQVPPVSQQSTLSLSFSLTLFSLPPSLCCYLALPATRLALCKCA